MPGTVRQFFQGYAFSVSPSPATGFMFNTGFNNVYTGSNSGINGIQNLERVQSMTDSLSQEYTTINQLGQLAFVSQEITTPATFNVGTTWNVADLSNDRIIGLNVSGGGVLQYILDQSQATKNLFLSLAPQGVDAIGWTGQQQVKLYSNAQLASWSTEGSVGNIPTTSASWQALNYATYTGSFSQPLFAIDINNGGAYVSNKLFTIPVISSGIAPTAAALRPSDISVDISDAAIGLSISDLKAQSYQIGFDLNVQPLQQLGNLFPYAIVPQFPIALNATFSFYFGDLITGSYKDVLCSNNPKNLRVRINNPCSATEAVAYEVRGVKITNQSFDSQDVSSIAGQVSISYAGQIGGPTDTRVNLLMSGRNVST